MFSTFKDAVTPYINDILEEVEVEEDGDGWRVAGAEDATQEHEGERAADELFSGPEGDDGHAPGGASDLFARSERSPSAHDVFDSEPSHGLGERQQQQHEQQQHGPGRTIENMQSVDLDEVDLSGGGGGLGDSPERHGQDEHPAAAWTPASSWSAAPAWTPSETFQNGYSDLQAVPPTVVKEQPPTTQAAPPPRSPSPPLPPPQTEPTEGRASSLTSAFGKTFAHLRRLREFARSPASTAGLEKRLSQLVAEGFEGATPEDLEDLDRQVAERWRSVRTKPTRIALGEDLTGLNIVVQDGLASKPEEYLEQLDLKARRAWAARTLRESLPAAEEQSHHRQDYLARAVGLEPASSAQIDQLELEEALGRRESDVSAKEAQVYQREVSIGQREAQLGVREADVRVQAGELEQQKKALADAQAALESRTEQQQRLFEQQEQQLLEQRQRIEQEQQQLREQRQHLEQQQQQLGEQRQHLEQQQQQQREQQQALAEAQTDHASQEQLEAERTAHAEAMAAAQGQMESMQEELERLRAALADQEAAAAEEVQQLRASAAAAEARTEAARWPEEYRRALEGALRSACAELERVEPQARSGALRDLLASSLATTEEPVLDGAQVGLAQLQQGLLGALERRLASEQARREELEGSLAALGTLSSWEAGESDPVGACLALVGHRYGLRAPEEPGREPALRAALAQLDALPAPSPAPAAPAAEVEAALRDQLGAVDGGAAGPNDPTQRRLAAVAEACAQQLAAQQQASAGAETDLRELARLALQVALVHESAAVPELGEPPRSPTEDRGVGTEEVDKTTLTTQTDLAVPPLSPPLSPRSPSADKSVGTQDEEAAEAEPAADAPRQGESPPTTPERPVDKSEASAAPAQQDGAAARASTATQTDTPPLDRSRRARGNDGGSSPGLPRPELVDKRLAASVVATCIERSCRRDCLDVVARVLDFDEEERRRVGLEAAGGGFWSALLPDWSRGQARAQAVNMEEQDFSSLLSEFINDEIH